MQEEYSWRNIQSITQITWFYYIGAAPTMTLYLDTGELRSSCNYYFEQYKNWRVLILHKNSSAAKEPVSVAEAYTLWK